MHVVNELKPQVVDVHLCLLAISLPTCRLSDICKDVLHYFPDFFLKPDNSNCHGFDLHRPSNKGKKLLSKVIKAIIIIITSSAHTPRSCVNFSKLARESHTLPPAKLLQQNSIGLASDFRLHSAFDLISSDPLSSNVSLLLSA